MDWVFFDCFNTLIDDFDSQGTIDGLETIAHLPVEAGIFPTAEAFREAFRDARAVNWWRPESEVHLAVRLHAVLSRLGGVDATAADRLVDQMMTAFEATYPATLRLTPRVQEMLEHWSKVARLAVVSNFFLPGWPQQVLEAHGLGRYFEFVVDSAVIGAKKPEPEIYLEALRLAGVGADKVLFVGDDYQRDVLAPRSHGMQARHVCRFGDRPGTVVSPEMNAVRHWDEFRSTEI
ncbi:MAG: HAD superfamily hydrolase (TIGR01549 family) [Candidatus Pseudothioglobus sp.]|jgi:HAD superfamily hydrolase (TIGR01549 family)